MTILAIDDCPQALYELTKSLQAAFPQEKIIAFAKALFALQYAYNHPKEIGLVFSAMNMRQMDGITLAQSMQKHSPGIEIFFLVQTESRELEAVAKQHGNGTCLIRPITIEKIKEATAFLYEPCQWEAESCENGCNWGWCNHREKKRG